MPFDPTKVPAPPKEEGGLAKTWRMLTHPITETLGLNPAIDKALAVGKSDSGVHSIGVGNRNTKGQPTASTTESAKKFPEKGDHPIVAPDEVGMFSKAGLKGFVQGATEAVTPGHIAAGLSLAPEVAALIGAPTAAASAPVQAAATLGNAAMGAEGLGQTIKDVKDPNASKAKVAMDVVNTGLGAFGAGKSYSNMRTASTAASAARKVAGAAEPTADLLKTQYESLLNDINNKDPRTVEELLKTKYPELDTDTLKKTGGTYAKKIWGEGTPQKPGGRPGPLTPAELHTQNATNAKASSKAEDQAFKLNQTEAAADAQINQSGLKDQEDAKKAGLKDLDSLIQQHFQTEKINAKATTAATKADEAAQKLRGAAEDANIKDTAKKAEEAAALAEADHKQSLIEARKEGTTPVEGPVRTTIKNGDEGFTVTHADPAPEDGEGGASSGGDGDSKPLLPTKGFFSLTKAKAHADQHGGVSVMDVTKQPDGSWLSHPKGAIEGPSETSTSDIVKEATQPWVDPIDAVNFKGALADARSNGFTGTDDELQRLYQKKLSDARGLMDEMNDSGYDQHEVLRQIAKYGGVTDKEHAGDLDPLWETSSGYLAGKGTRKDGGVKLGRKLATGGFHDIPNVLKLKGGRNLDDMARLLAQDQRFSYLNGPDDVIKAIKEAAATSPKKALELPEALGVAGFKQGEPWWSGPSGDNPDVEVSDFTGGEPLHTIEATIPSGTPGEAEPNLPGVEGPIGGVPKPLATDVPNNLNLISENATPNPTQTSLLDAPEGASQAPVEALPQGEGAAPIRLFKSPLEAAGANYGAIKDAKAAGEVVPEEGRAAAGMAASRLKQEAVTANPSSTDLSKMPELQQDSVLKEMVQRFMSEKGSRKGFGDESGAVDPMLAMRMGLAGLGGTVGYQEDPLGNKPLSAIAGAGGGLVAPDLLSKALPALTNIASKSAAPIEKGLDVLNNVHNAALLSPLSVAKKAAGDVGGLSLAALENPEKAGDLLRQFTTPEGRAGLKEAFKAGFKGPEQEAATGLDNFNFQNWQPSNMVGKAVKGALTASGKTMGGLTTMTKTAMGEAGLSPQQQRYYTLTDYPSTSVGESIYNAIRGNKILGHLSPFARIGVNRLERGVEYSPLGLINSGLKDPEAAKKIFAKAFLGTTVGIGSYMATPDNFVKDHPTAASSVAALGGPLGLLMLAGMAAKQVHRGNNEGGIASSIDDASKAVAQDIPGLRLIEDLSAKSKTAFARNYFSGYTNVARPLALGLDKIRGITEEPDVSSPTLSTKEKLFNRMLSNIPGVRDTLPKKGAGNIFEVAHDASNPQLDFDPAEAFKVK